MIRRSRSSGHRGLSLIELTIALALATMLMMAINGVTGQALKAFNATSERVQLNRQAQFAMQRIAAAILGSDLVLVPQVEDLYTAYSESVRDVLAVSLDPYLDRDSDGYADADNDRNGKVNDKLSADHTNDSKPGIVGIDDDNDGVVDESTASNNDNDEAGTLGASGSGLDWLDVVAFFVTNGQLIERMPNINSANGNDYTERVIADNVTLFQVTRSFQGVAGNRMILLEIMLTLTGASGGQVSLSSQLRAGAGA